MFDSSSPTLMEQTTLAEIEAISQQLLAELRAVPANASAVVLASIVGRIDTYAQRFQTMTARAQWLSNRGYPGVVQRLTFVQRDLESARAQRVQMQQDAMRTAQQQQYIWANANAVATNNVLGGIASSQASFNRSMQGFFDVWENRCYDCHRTINVVAGSYCLDCARQRGLI